MKLINLTQGKSAIVDDDMYEKINKHNWYYRRGYALREIMKLGKKRIIYMHREVNQTPDGMQTDHINGNTLDNRKSNLRTVTLQQNMHNQGIRKNTSSKYKGVYWYKAGRKWRAQIQIDKQRVYLGQFDSEVEAAIAYNEAARKFFGEYARLNPIGEKSLA